MQAFGWPLCYETRQMSSPVKQIYFKQQNPVCRSFADLDVTESCKKPNGPFMVSQREPNIDVKDEKNWQMPQVTPEQKWVVCTWGETRKKKENRPQSFCDTASSCQVL